MKCELGQLVYHREHPEEVLLVVGFDEERDPIVMNLTLKSLDLCPYAEYGFQICSLEEKGEK